MSCGQVIVGALKWRQLSEPLAVHVQETPDERGKYPIAATPRNWGLEHDEPEPWIRGEAWVENRDNRAVVVWRMPQRRYLPRARGGTSEDGSYGPRFEWDYEP
jgi:hypothetical protein